MSAVLFDLSDPPVEQNATYESPTFLWLDPDGNPVDLSTATAALTVRNTPDASGDELLTITQSSGITLGGAEGTVAWAFSATETNDLPMGQLFYTLRIVISPKAYMFASGAVQVRGSTV
jgi:hypothetical protein